MLIETHAPGRICIFGEHQDYLGHPVIAGAINLFFHIRGQARQDMKFIIHKKDFDTVESFTFPDQGEIPFDGARDYFKSVLNLLRRQGITIGHGAEVDVWSSIPIEAGASSSSALNVVWHRFLSQLFNTPWKDDRLKIGELSFISEVAMFNEPGGRMDQYTSSLGGINYLDFKNHIHEPLRQEMTGFILIDSLQKKDTFGMLKRVKEGQQAALKEILEKTGDIYDNNKDKPPLILEIEEKDLDFLPKNLQPYGKAAVLNFQLTMAGRQFLKKDPIDAARFGQYLQQQHRVLREYLQNTTPKIDRILEIAMENGASGGKMNGSGGGGTLFVYAPGKEEQVIEKIKSDGLVGPVRTDIVEITS